MKKKEISLGKKIKRNIISLIMVGFLIYFAYYLIHYYLYDAYKECLSTYIYEEGKDFTPLNENIKDVEGYSLVAENEELKMYINEDTTDVAIFDKRNHTTVYSIPNKADEDTVANTTNINYLKSQIILDYYNSSRGTGIYDSYSMSVERGQFHLETIECGVRIIYDIGDHSKSDGIVPLYMANEKYEEILSALSGSDKDSFERYYSSKSDVKDMKQLISVASKNRIALEKIEGYLLQVNFTEDDYAKQMELAGVETVKEASFEIPLEYRLVDDGIKVSIPVSGIKEHGDASIYRIQLLRNFAAAGVEETGYMVVPNGDGSIIRFNNGKTNVANYSQYIYGIDPLLADYTVLENTNQSTLPIFAICRKDSSILAIIEEGASLALINAGVSGKFNEFNYIYPSFVLRGGDTLAMFGTTGNEAELPIVEKEMYDVNLSVTYKFLTEENKGYSGVANYYREQLFAEGTLEINKNNLELPFYYDVITGVEQSAFFLGNQYMDLTQMTTFQETENMVDEFIEAGIENQIVNVQGWFNGGYYHDVADLVKVPFKLGGKEKLKELDSKIESVGGKMYVDVLFQEVPYTSKRYSMQNESSKYYGSGYVVSLGQVNPTNLRKTASLGYEETMYYLISPKYLGRYIDSFIEKTDFLEFSGYSLRDLGDELHSDKKRTNIINREEALLIVKENIKKFDKTNKDVMVSNPNQYAWVYANDIINLPLDDNKYPIIDERIPLYEMIIHGSINYSGQVYNLNSKKNKEDFILNSIEYGASPHFVFTKEEASEMKYSGMNAFYATTFDIWKEESVLIYNEISSVLNEVLGEQMLSHEIIDEYVRKIEYSNGIIIYVNYGNEDIKINGINISAKGYALGGLK